MIECLIRLWVHLPKLIIGEFMGKVIPIKEVKKQNVVIQNPWHRLREFTSARIALGRSGTSVPTSELLKFQLDHAKAMDAVHCDLDTDRLLASLCSSYLTLQHTPEPPMVLESEVSDRLMYLQRPDLGRRLSSKSWRELKSVKKELNQDTDLVIAIADGLSSVAIQTHAIPVVNQLLSMLSEDDEHRWNLAPIVIIKQGRVAAGDDVAECLNAKMVLLLIGERPGLTSPDSMGMYLTWGARRGSRDSERNCISNVRPEGQPYEETCHRAMYLLKEARKLQLSGVGLKDRSSMDEGSPESVEDNASENFLISSK